MKVAFSSLLKDIEKNLSPVYLFSGNENFHKEELLKKILKTIPEEVLDLNYDVFYGGENEAGGIITQALTLPFGSPRRVILIKSAEALSHSDRETILSYVKNPCKETILIIICEVKGSKDTFFRELAKKAVEIEFRQMYENEIIPWLIGRAKRLGKNLSYIAASELREHAGGDPGILSNELEKLGILVGERKEIQPEDVAASCGETRSRTGFELADAIGNKKLTLSLRVLESLLNAGKGAPEIIGILAWHFRRIWKTRIYMERGMNQLEISKALGAPYFQIKKLSSQTRKFTDKKLEEAFKSLLEADIEAKSTQKAKLTLELLFMKLCEHS